MTGWRYPNLHAACFAIALARGDVNRFSDATDVHNSIADWVDRQDDNDLPPIEAWLGTLTKDELDIVTDGDDEDAKRILTRSPPLSADLLARFFEGE